MLAQPNGNALAELTTATGKQLRFKRNGVPEASFTIAHEDDAAKLLLDSLKNDGIPQLKCYRDGILRFNGYLAPFEEQLEEQATLAAAFRGPFGVLLGDGDGLGRFTAAVKTFTQVDAGQIAKTLIDDANTESATGVATTGGIEATRLRDRTYEYANVGEAIVDLTNVLDGFDFEVSPVDSGSTIGEFRVYAKQGQAKDAAAFVYGENTLNNLRAIQRQTFHPVNEARVLGAEGLVGLKSDAASIVKYRKRFRQVSASDVSEQATLDDKAQALLRSNPIRVVTCTPDPALAPSPWDDFWLGDTVPVQGERGAFVEDLRLRVNEIAVVVDDNGEEVAEIPDPSDPEGEASLRALLTTSESIQ